MILGNVANTGYVNAATQQGEFWNCYVMITDGEPLFKSIKQKYTNDEKRYVAKNDDSDSVFFSHLFNMTTLSNACESKINTFLAPNFALMLNQKNECDIESLHKYIQVDEFDGDEALIIGFDIHHDDLATKETMKKLLEILLEEIKNSNDRLKMIFIE